jgi:hypothetical protein
MSDKREPRTDEPTELEYDEQRDLSFYGSDSDYYREPSTPLPPRSTPPNPESCDPPTMEERAEQMAIELREDPELLREVLVNLHGVDNESIKIARPWDRGDEEDGYGLTRWGGEPQRVLAQVYAQKDGTFSSTGGGPIRRYDTEKEAVEEADRELRLRGFILTGTGFPR